MNYITVKVPAANLVPKDKWDTDIPKSITIRAMTDLETMQREGREGFDVDTEDTHDVNDEIGYRMADYLDQHTANTWKACLATILESGLLEEKVLIRGLAFRDQNIQATSHNTLAKDMKEYMSNMDNKQGITSLHPISK